MSEMEMNLTKVAQNDKNNKIGHWNYELGENLSDLIEKVTTEIWNEYNLLVQDLLYEGEGDVQFFLYHIDDDRLIQELENIKKSCLNNKNINQFKENLKPYSHLKKSDVKNFTTKQQID